MNKIFLTVIISLFLILGVYAATIATISNQNATEDTQFSFNVNSDLETASQADYSLTTAPTGMIINSATGLITWTPINSQVGNNNVVVIPLHI